MLDDLSREHDVGVGVLPRQPSHHPVAVEHVDEVSLGLEPALAGTCDLLRVDLDPAELDPLVASKALEEEPAREAEVEDSLPRQVADALPHEAVHLRVAVLDVEEEALVVPPGGVVRELEEPGRAHVRIMP